MYAVTTNLVDWVMIALGVFVILGFLVREFRIEGRRTKAMELSSLAYALKLLGDNYNQKEN